MAKNRFTDIAKNASKKTDAQFATELTRLTKLTRVDLEQMLPTRADQERLAQLMAIVDSSAKENTKLARLKSNLDELGPVVLRILKALT